MVTVLTLVKPADNFVKAATDPGKAIFDWLAICETPACNSVTLLDKDDSAAKATCIALASFKICCAC